MKAYQEEYEMTDDDYERTLDEIYGDVEICGMTFSAGRALKELDPIAFRVGKADYADGMENTNPWFCGLCNTEYDNENEAEDCCTYTCNVCGERFETAADAVDCEDSHDESEES